MLHFCPNCILNFCRNTCSANSLDWAGVRGTCSTLRKTSAPSSKSRKDLFRKLCDILQNNKVSFSYLLRNFIFLRSICKLFTFGISLKVKNVCGHDYYKSFYLVWDFHKWNNLSAAFCDKSLLLKIHLHDNLASVFFLITKVPPLSPVSCS